MHGWTSERGGHTYKKSTIIMHMKSKRKCNNQTIYWMIIKKANYMCTATIMGLLFVRFHFMINGLEATYVAVISMLLY